MAKDHKRRNRRGGSRSRILPDDEEDTDLDNGHVNSAYEMDSIAEEKRNNRDRSSAGQAERSIVEKFQKTARKSVSKKNAINLISNIKSGLSKWRNYATGRRSANKESGSGGHSGVSENYDRRRTGGGLASELGDIGGKDNTDGHATSSTHKSEMVIAHNRNLIEYFARMGQSKEADASINLEYVASLLKNGANINCTDKYGQSVFHEVARAWHTDVAQFLIEQNADINHVDNYGRTPLHVSAAVDYPEMVTFLINNGANKEARTKGEHQTPVYFAARNDACLSLKALLKQHCEYKDVRDYKGRTPLHVAAELDRSETARMLLELDDPAPAGVEDDSGQAAIVWMITKMPPVAKLALDQFHTMDRANRKQYFHLHKLEPRKPDEEQHENYPQTALQVTVAYRRLDLIIHPALSQLIKKKWVKFGRFGALLQIVMNILFIVSWSAVGLVIEYDKRHRYILPDQIWRIVLYLIAIGLTVWQLKDELTEFYVSRKNYQKWRQWREEEIQKDIKMTHPRWKEEEQYLTQEIEELDKIQPVYASDFWNIFDWICYAMLLVSIITHLVDIFHHTNFVARFHIRVMAVTIIIIWLRLLKNARAFAFLGPFIVMLTHMFVDCIRFCILYMEFYIPFACAFWMLYGGDKVPEEFQGLPDASNNTMIVEGMNTPDALLFTLFRLTLVDEYDYNGMKAVDPIMADLLLACWFVISAIFMLNLLIALLSDTFQRVYDNAQANAVMQKAITILGVEEGLSHKRREKFRTYIHTQCNPEMMFYDDDAVNIVGEDLKKVTIQIKEDLDELREQMHEERLNRQIKEDNLDGSTSHDDGDDDDDDHQGGRGRRGGRKMVTVDKFETEIATLQLEIRDLKTQQKDLMGGFKREVKDIKRMLATIATTMGGGGGGGGGGDDEADSVHPQMSTMLSRESTLSSQHGSLAGLIRPQSSRTQIVGHGVPRRESSLTGAPQSTFQTFTGGSMDIMHDEEWERSERERKRELRKLRQRLGQAEVEKPATPPSVYPSYTYPQDAMVLNIPPPESDSVPGTSSAAVAPDSAEPNVLTVDPAADPVEGDQSNC